MFTKFAELLDRGLHNTATRITNDVKADLHIIGSHIEIIECNLDTTIARMNQNTNCIQTLQEQLETANAKMMTSRTETGAMISGSGAPQNLVKMSRTQFALSLKI